jgi:hypothetical protein
MCRVVPRRPVVEMLIVNLDIRSLRVGANFLYGLQTPKYIRGDYWCYVVPIEEEKKVVSTRLW